MHRRNPWGFWGKYWSDPDYLGRKLRLKFDVQDLYGDGPRTGPAAFVRQGRAIIDAREHYREKRGLQFAALAVHALGRGPTPIISSRELPDPLTANFVAELSMPARELQRVKGLRARDLAYHFDTYAGIVRQRYYSAPQLFALPPEEFFEPNWDAWLISDCRERR